MCLQSIFVLIVMKVFFCFIQKEENKMVKSIKCTMHHKSSHPLFKKDWICDSNLHSVHRFRSTTKNIICTYEYQLRSSAQENCMVWNCEFTKRAYWEEKNEFARMKYDKTIKYTQKHTHTPHTVFSLNLIKM